MMKWLTIIKPCHCRGPRFNRAEILSESGPAVACTCAKIKQGDQRWQVWITKQGKYMSATQSLTSNQLMEHNCPGRLKVITYVQWHTVIGRGYSHRCSVQLTGHNNIPSTYSHRCSVQLTGHNNIPSTYSHRCSVQLTGHNNIPSTYSHRCSVQWS